MNVHSVAGGVPERRRVPALAFGNLSALATIAASIWIARRRWLVIRPEGFTLIDPAGERTCFEPRSRGPTVRYAANLRALDDELERLREHDSSVVAARMAEELAAGRPVVWTPSLSLTPDGIEHRPWRLFGGEPPVVHAWGEVAGFTIHEGYLHLNLRSGRGIREAVSAPNFFPGFVLLSSMFQPDRAAAGA